MNSAVPMSDSGGKRPALVWAILVLYTFGVVITLASMYALLSGALRLPATDAAFEAGFGTVNFLGLGVSTILSVAFMVQLFRMRKSAAYLATAGLLVMIVKALYYQPKLARLGHSATPALIGDIVAFLIVCYTWHLKRTGALR
jgi:hypothetical protein